MTRTINRPQFLDRVMTIEELHELTDMLRQWYRIAAAMRPGEQGYCLCDAIIHTFPRPDREAICDALSARLPGASIDQSDPDELRIVSPLRKVTESADVEVWRHVLAEPLLAHACVILRFTIHGFVHEPRGAPLSGSTFVFCGAPAPGGALLLKAIWPVDLDEQMALMYRYAQWPSESEFLAAFETYLFAAKMSGELAAGERSFAMFRKNEPVFMTRVEHRLARWFLRMWAELPDDHGPLAFARRLILPLIVAIGLALAALALPPRNAVLRPACAIIAVLLALLALRVAWTKARSVRQYYTAMRRGLDKLYSQPVTHTAIDLSDDQTPTLLKYSGELHVMGAVHLGDISITVAGSTFDSNRTYALNDMAISVGLLRKTENLVMFPPMPILFLTTRFAGGQRHITVNRLMYRKRTVQHITAKCLKTSRLDELIALHRCEVDKLIATGVVPAPPVAERLIEQMAGDFEEGRGLWRRRPYSWMDAIHEVFRVPRREYRP